MKETDGDTPAPEADTTFYVTDHLGSVVVLLDNDGEQIGGYSYDPYGQERATTEGAAEENIIRYAGAQYDIETGLYKMGHRYYDPSTGRFTQPDPSGAEENQYLYAANNPTNFVDPTGLLSSGGSVEVCHWGACLGGGVDDEGNLHVEAGVGTPGITVEAGVSAGEREGAYGSASCGLGAPIAGGGSIGGSIDESGNVSGGANRMYGTSGCSATAGYQF